MKRFLSFAFGCFLSYSAHAATYPVDDSASVVLSPLIQMKWDQIAPNGQNQNLMRGQTDVLVRLNTRPFQSKVGRVFIVLNNQALGRVRATWQTNGVLFAGTVRSGERALVYSGPMTQSVIEDTMHLTIETNGSQLERDQQLQFSFEVDID